MASKSGISILSQRPVQHRLKESSRCRCHPTGRLWEQDNRQTLILKNLKSPCPSIRVTSNLAHLPPGASIANRLLNIRDRHLPIGSLAIRFLPSIHNEHMRNLVSGHTDNGSAVTIERTIERQHNVSAVRNYAVRISNRIPSTSRKPSARSRNPLVATLSPKLRLRRSVHNRLKIFRRNNVIEARIRRSPSCRFAVIHALRCFPPRHEKGWVNNFAERNLLAVFVKPETQRILATGINLHTGSGDANHHWRSARTSGQLHDIPKFAIRLRVNLIERHQRWRQTFFSERLGR